ncbi:MAG: FapA family protein [Lachnospiraceae bacterium]|nr:FapA family protein [Lachnospiraceae bacterium]
MANGYFQLVNLNGGTAVRIVPPTEGGEAVALKEVMSYLDLHKVVYDSKIIGAVVNASLSSGKTEQVLIDPSKVYTERESYAYFPAEDRMSVSVRFYPPTEGAEKMTDEEFYNDLKIKGIVAGIDEAAVKGFFASRDYCKTILVAKGTPAVEGHDAKIEYFFNTDPHIKPALNEDGSVNFFELNTVNHVKAGDLLARRTPEDRGKDGIDVFGKPVRPKPVVTALLHYGHNINVSEDKNELTSAVNGHVQLVDDSVFVSDLLELTNVDNSTGNIKYDGSVHVSGNVVENFSLEAGGSVTVDGVVEGAHIIAGGDIIIARGMNGMNKGVLEAKGNVVVKFLENATVKAEGNVTAESMLHSFVSAGAEILCTGKRGFITGGRVSATSQVKVRTLGSSLGADTVIEVGANPALKMEYSKLQKSIPEIEGQIKQIDPVLVNIQAKLAKGVKLEPNQMKYVSTLVATRKQKLQELETSQKRMEELQEMLGFSAEASVIVEGEVYPGTKICIGDVSKTIQNAVKYCRFIKSQGDVKLTSI